MAESKAKAAIIVASATAAVGLLAYLLNQRRNAGDNRVNARTLTNKSVQKLYLIGIDLGATNAKAGVVRGTDGVLLASASIPLEAKDPSAVVASLMLCVNRVCTEASVDLDEVAAVGIGSPGHVFNGVVKAAANFKDWKDVPLAALLQRNLGGSIPVRLVNDADAALAAECWVGAASSQGEGTQGAIAASTSSLPRDVVMVTLGSGVGVAVLVAGAILQGSRGLIEGGHSIVHLDHATGSSGPRAAFAAARPCGCGQWGCAEAYISANSVRARFHEACVIRDTKPLAQNKGKLAPQRLPVPDDAKSTADIFALAYDGGRRVEDRSLAQLAVDIVDETARILALFIVNLCRFYDPQIILLGGGMAEAGEYFLAAVRSHFEKVRWTILPDHVEIRRAKLGSDAGIVGAAAVVREFAASASV